MSTNATSKDMLASVESINFDNERNRMKKLLVSAALVTASMFANAVMIGNAMSGNDYLRMNGDSRAHYIAGIIDGFTYANALADANLKSFDQLQTCFAKMRPTHGQLTAIVDTWLNQHPAQWGYGMNSVTFWAISEACLHLGVQLPQGS